MNTNDSRASWTPWGLIRRHRRRAGLSLPMGTLRTDFDSISWSKTGWKESLMVTTMRGTSLSNKLSTFRSNVILVLITSRTYGTLTRSLRRTGRPWTPPCKRNARKRMSAVNSWQKRTESPWTAFQRKNKLYSQTNGNSSGLRSKRCSRNCSPSRKIIDDNSSSRFFSLLLKLLRRLKVIWSCARSNERSNSEKCSVITLFRWSW
jgi:hypothetical protein